jgi:hypothetical protein
LMSAMCTNNWRITLWASSKAVRPSYSRNWENATWFPETTTFRVTSWPHTHSKIL